MIYSLYTSLSPYIYIYIHTYVYTYIMAQQTPAEQNNNMFERFP